MVTVQELVVETIDKHGNTRPRFLMYDIMQFEVSVTKNRTSHDITFYQPPIVHYAITTTAFIPLPVCFSDLKFPLVHGCHGDGIHITVVSHVLVLIAHCTAISHVISVLENGRAESSVVSGDRAHKNLPFQNCITCLQ